MNAIAFDGEKYVDVFGGIEDIHNATIRCVGDANARFQEDALRILRAMRFAAQFGFEIEQYAIALPKGSDLAAKINQALTDLKADGTFDALVAQYIEGEE